MVFWAETILRCFGLTLPVHFVAAMNSSLQSGVPPHLKLGLARACLLAVLEIVALSLQLGLATFLLGVKKEKWDNFKSIFLLDGCIHE